MVEKETGEELQEPGSDAVSASDDAVVFRSDTELWPPELQPPKPMKRHLRLQLRRLYRDHGCRVKECLEDLKEVKAKAESFTRSCAAQKDAEGMGRHAISYMYPT